jgi:DNA invertase Pin-like site-specific DNA recombinase
MRAVAYIRVSDLSQVEGYSLDAQERLFLQHCKTKGWTPIQVYREEGRSAHSDSIRKRPVFRQLLDDARQGQFDVVVVHTLDRWARNQRVMLESLAILAEHQVALASLTENIDYSTPQGRLFIQMLGGFAQYFSDSLATHVSKGLTQRAIQGRHVGGIPFGYASCWESQGAERKRLCIPEHPGGVHLVGPEANAVTEMFREYATGTATSAQLAMRLNDQGFCTRNTKKLPGPDGLLTSGPRLFTTASVKVILHNAFYAGLVKHNDELYQGAHEPLIGKETFDLVETNLRKNSGRSKTLAPHPEREYLLKGLIRCAYCLMPICQTQLHKCPAPGPDNSPHANHPSTGGAEWLTPSGQVGWTHSPPIFVGSICQQLPRSRIKFLIYL